tara:strand:- start:997 stop:1707 length:711 start_codon:yes stop_codon:yes gene_type:complete
MYKNRSPQISLNALFFGSEQSKYAGIALFGTIFILCLAILFSNSKIPIDQRLAFVIFIMLVAIPSILMSLFELTCIVTGGNIKYRWWCWLLAWVIAVVIILYCLMVVISLIMSMANFDIANQRVENNEENNKIDTKTADEYAKNVIKQYEDETKNIVKEDLYNEDGEDSQNLSQTHQTIEQDIASPNEEFNNEKPLANNSDNNNQNKNFLMSNQYNKQEDYLTGLDRSDVFAHVNS